MAKRAIHNGRKKKIAATFICVIILKNGQGNDQ
jgi:hypothetical protein